MTPLFDQRKLPPPDVAADITVVTGLLSRKASAVQEVLVLDYSPRMMTADVAVVFKVGNRRAYATVTMTEELLAQHEGASDYLARIIHSYVQHPERLKL